jgi:hypothetical protein
VVLGGDASATPTETTAIAMPMEAAATRLDWPADRYLSDANVGVLEAVTDTFEVGLMATSATPYHHGDLPNARAK